jgi:hypothetical protein
MLLCVTRVCGPKETIAGKIKVKVTLQQARKTQRGVEV